MTAVPKWLLADIGGTNARFSLLVPGGAPTHYRALKAAVYRGPAAAARAYLKGLKGSVAMPEEAAIAVAAPIVGDRIKLTNSPWEFSVRGLRRDLGLRRLRLLNDFEALAWALPALGAADLGVINTGRARAGAPLAVFGPGTGLGVSCFVPGMHGARGTALTTEGGHMTLAPGTAREAAVVECLRTRFGHVSAERVLSGPGLANIYGALVAIESGAAGRPLSPARVAQRARDGSDPLAAEAVAMFSGIAGQFAGDLALVYGALGGVFLAGGVIPKLGAAFDTRLFRRRFVAKGRYRSWLGRIPVRLVTHPRPAMIGLAAYLGDSAEG